MKEKVANEAFHIIKKIVHQWKPIAWAGYDDDEPDIDKNDSDYESAKSMLVDDLDGSIKSIVKQLPRVKTESDMFHVLLRTYSELDDEICTEACKKNGAKLFRLLRESNAI
ncbi:MAG: hypothetical protein ACI82Q_002765 [Nonlabens sp.]|jgi:hypothetical protein